MKATPLESAATCSPPHLIVASKLSSGRPPTSVSPLFSNFSLSWSGGGAHEGGEACD